MARETKVGLLAGLAFIICFAIILANRGRQEPVATQLAYRVDGGFDVQHAVQPAASPKTVHQQPAKQDQSDPPADSLTPALTERSNPTRIVLPRDRPPLAEPSAPRPSGTSIQQAAPTTTAVQEANTDASLPVTTDNARIGRTLTLHPQDVVERRRALQEHLDALSTRLEKQDGSEDAARSRGIQDTRHERGQRVTGGTAVTRAPTVVPRARGTLYTVVPGDTLSKIAATHYGKQSATIVNAIFQANRSVLSSPDVLQVGVTLVLPVISGANAPTGAASSVRKPSAAPVHPSPARIESGQRLFRWYQIRKNDRYISIAREQLGDAGRWREIYELNQDKFPDPQRIREGVRIKLPVTGVAVAQGGRR